MKLKLPHWEIISFAVLNLIYAAGYFVAIGIPISIIIYFLVVSKENPSSLEFNFYTVVFLISLLALIFHILFRNFYLYILTKIIFKKGDEKYKNIVIQVKQNYILQLLILSACIVLDIFFITVYIVFNILPGDSNSDFIIKTLSYIFCYYVGGGLLPAYVVTFLIFGIEKYDKERTRLRTFKPKNLDVYCNQSDKYPYNYKKRRKFASIHKDRLRQNLTECHIQHCTRCKTQTQSQTQCAHITY